ncbi:MAG TPA: EthD family reductase [Candidatus Kryptonia bacterium]|nr:EthD family reductase [Candidatus Kryptonia bacterium]
MVKLIFFCRRRPDITHERYVGLLLGSHVPLALKHHPAMRKYVVNIVESCPDGWESFDSIGELSFDNLADYRERLYDSEAGRRIIEADVRQFMGGAHAYITTERVQRSQSRTSRLAARSPGTKMICPVVRRAEMSHAQFVAHWQTRHVPLALAHHPGMSGYVTNIVDDRLSTTGEALDGVAELYFPSVEARRGGMFDSIEGERVIRDDMARFIGRTAAYRVAEYVQRA